MKRLSRLLPIIGGAIAGGAIALAVASGSTTTHSVTTTTVVQPSTSSTLPTSFTSGRSESINQIYRSVGPGVVDITTSSTQNSGGVFGFGQSQQTEGEGAGVVFDKKGDIITDEHVVSGASKITVTFPDQVKASATLVGSDTGTDLAVIHVQNVPSSELHPLTIGDSNAVQVGDAVIAIGSPFGLPNTVTAGIVSAVGRTINAPNEFTIPNAIQTDAPINPGNSGGPLVNAAGQVIGLNDQIETNNTNGEGEGSSSGIGFATPSNSDARIAREIISTGQAHNAYVGVEPRSDGFRWRSDRQERLDRRLLADRAQFAGGQGRASGGRSDHRRQRPGGRLGQPVRGGDRQLRARRHRDPDGQPQRADEEHQGHARLTARERHHRDPGSGSGSGPGRQRLVEPLDPPRAKHQNELPWPAQAPAAVV